MRPAALFHLDLSPPGSQAASDAKKHTLTFAAIAQHLTSSAGVSAGGFDHADTA
ncbi:hypothetical protein FIBSPDRAFT_851188 [Athelia psychrophila]|uniref:Uncharacterized protein n=1 Tax=Athelia psychrophila TaxID=1759441 RepID=A0A166SMS9_9AGAM|nr:hypothetical protein FIBSPDRAFT_851188 [Fibularhizoctonia sp. CBS 109695]